MRNSIVWLALIATVALSGCTSQSQMLDNKQAMAIQTALSRGKFDLNCPQATGEILSREVTQPAIQGPWLSGIQRAEYTVGVSGCGQRTTFLVLCPQGGESCFAADPGARIR
jgi:hypothetical protein